MERNMLCLFVGLLTVFMLPCFKGYTYEQDVFAINGLYNALGSPRLDQWNAFGGDPCGEAWQGVQCVNSNITGIVLNGVNLGGELGNSLANFTSIIILDLSYNHIGGSIPEKLPPTIQQFFLADNELTGSIPITFSDLSFLTSLSLNNNLLGGQIPDSFQQLSSLLNLDLSYNNLSGQFPASMMSLSALTTLHVQHNKLSGTLDLLKDLPLIDLNVENNLFSGPVPAKLLNIPNFKKDGNLFNATSPPSSPSGRSSGEQGNSTYYGNSYGKESKKSTKIIMIALAAVVSAIFVLILIIVVLRCCCSKSGERMSDHEHPSKKVDMPNCGKPGKANKISNNLTPPPDQNISRYTVTKEQEITSMNPPVHMINDGGGHQPPTPPVVKVIAKHTSHTESVEIPSPEYRNTPHGTSSAVSFSVALLQQYTDSFCEDNIIREGRLGKIYQANFPDGKQLMVMKLDNNESKLPVESFLERILHISELQHPNIVELVGYCVGFGQRLLVYKPFCKRSLFDVLHCDDDFRRLSWNSRIKIALGASKALEYLHEACDPPIIHQHVESANILLDDELRVHVCDCGLASLPSMVSSSQFADRRHMVLAYEAPELCDSCKHTDRSDVYSLGVVMLELLTGRAPHNSSHARQEQNLVKWASSQLHDIDSLLRMMDPAIQGKCELRSLSRFADIINRCIQREPEFRPPVSEVVQDLMRILAEAGRRAC